MACDFDTQRRDEPPANCFIPSVLGVRSMGRLETNDHTVSTTLDTFCGEGFATQIEISTNNAAGTKHIRQRAAGCGILPSDFLVVSRNIAAQGRILETKAGSIPRRNSGRGLNLSTGSGLERGSELGTYNRFL